MTGTALSPSGLCPPSRSENAGAEKPAETKLPAHQGDLSLVGQFLLSVGKHAVKKHT